MYMMDKTPFPPTGEVPWSEPPPAQPSQPETFQPTAEVEPSTETSKPPRPASAKPTPEDSRLEPEGPSPQPLDGLASQAPPVLPEAIAQAVEKGHYQAAMEQANQAFSK